ncbi:MAG TPA: hypothetical protein VGM53_28495 [Streptosporangiaceae bacterium]
MGAAGHLFVIGWRGVRDPAGPDRDRVRERPRHRAACRPPPPTPLPPAPFATVPLGTVPLGTVPLGTALLGTALLGTALLSTAPFATVPLLPTTPGSAGRPASGQGGWAVRLFVHVVSRGKWRHEALLVEFRVDVAYISSAHQRCTGVQ